MSGLPKRLADAGKGTIFSGRPRTLNLPRILAFSGGAFDEKDWPNRNLHTDDAMACMAGLDGVIASGTQSEGILIGFLRELCGRRWHSHGTLDVRFVKSVGVGETIYPRVRFVERARHGDTECVTFEVSCDNTTGDAVVTGRASCLFKSPRKRVC